MISLPEAQDRRNRIPHHLAQAGITRFEFHDACGPDHPQVKSLYDNGLVLRYPPCFRCGRKDCGKPDCNNVLIPAQVANFASNMSVWRRIAAANQRALVLEDDVVLHDWAPETLRWLTQRVEAGELTFRADVPKLLRMGAPLGPDHDPTLPRRLSADIRMSNYCYAMTAAFARLALARFKKVDTTSDIFLHKNVPQGEEALTVFPLIASDLSWSLGAVESAIHPKPLHVHYLRSNGKTAEADAHEAKIMHHLKHKFWRNILVLGHPGCGTGAAVRAMRGWGLDIGHETDGKDGLSSWHFAVDDKTPSPTSPALRTRAALACRTTVQIVRDPAAAVVAILREDQLAPASFAYRRKHVLAQTGVDLLAAPSDLDRAVLSLTLWSQIIRSQSPTGWFRIEDELSALRALLALEGDRVNLAASAAYADFATEDALAEADTAAPPVTTPDWASLSPPSKAALSAYCQTYGYAPIV